MSASTPAQGGGRFRAFAVTLADVRACPRRSLLPSHYNLDGTCRCEDEAGQRERVKQERLEAGYRQREFFDLVYDAIRLALEDRPYAVARTIATDLGLGDGRRATGALIHLHGTGRIRPLRGAERDPREPSSQWVLGKDTGWAL